MTILTNPFLEIQVNLKYISTSVIALADFAQRRDILTGTPMPQTMNDIFSQIDFLWPGNQLFLRSSQSLSEEDRILEVNDILKPLYVRTTKHELGLPKLKISLRKVELGPAQNEIYQLIRSETARTFRNLNRSDLETFRRLGRHMIRLIQAASNPMLITGEENISKELEGWNSYT